MRLRAATTLHTLRRPAAALAALCCAALACATAVAGEPAKPAHTIQDPHYGDVLFQFYQDHYFTAVTNLMVSQRFDRVPQHADEAELLRGGMLLSYGLHREAGEIFAKLIERTAEPPVRDRAWFYLAKIRYQRGLVDQAQEAMDRIGDHLPPELAQERGLLAANILMARRDYAKAAELLATLAKRKEGASPYARFNLGVALIKSGDFARGSALLDALGREGAENEERRALRDKANVALGFAALQAGQAAQARTYLERVRLQSTEATKALLGFGWAAAALKEPKLALVPWSELSGRDASDSAVLEARIAVPYAYAELGAYRESLQHYQDAIAAYEREDKELADSITAVRSGGLIDEMIERNPGAEMGWFWRVRALPEAMPQAGRLAHLFAQHEFQEAFKNYRDLRFLEKNLADWQDKLGVYGDMLDNRRQAYADRLPEVRAKARDTGIAELQAKRDALAAQFEQARAAQDGLALANARERELLARLDRVDATLRTMKGADADVARQRARRARGAMTWQLAEQYTARVWDTGKGVKAIDDGLAEARRRDAAITQAQKDEPARFDRFAERQHELAARIAALAPRVTALADEQQGQVQDLIVADLQRQRELLAGYTTQARFAVAQIYDRATAAREDDHAGAQ